VERDHGPPTEGTASLHTTLGDRHESGAKSGAREPTFFSRIVPAVLDPLCMFDWLRGLLREEVGRNVSDQTETDEETHALCEALIASEERSDP
jgi:hypothetical protein